MFQSRRLHHTSPEDTRSAHSWRKWDVISDDRLQRTALLTLLKLTWDQFWHGVGGQTLSWLPALCRCLDFTWGGDRFRPDCLRVVFCPLRDGWRVKPAPFHNRPVTRNCWPDLNPLNIVHLFLLRWAGFSCGLFLNGSAGLTCTLACVRPAGWAVFRERVLKMKLEPSSCYRRAWLLCFRPFDLFSTAKWKENRRWGKTTDFWKNDYTQSSCSKPVRVLGMLLLAASVRSVSPGVL